jgi:hypothetical protein
MTGGCQSIQWELLIHTRERVELKVSCRKLVVESKCAGKSGAELLRTDFQISCERPGLQLERVR